MKTEAMWKLLGKLLDQYEGRHIKPVSTARIVPETRHHPIAPPRPNSLLGLVKPYEWGLLIRADNAVYTPMRRSYGESMADRVEMIERITHAAAAVSGSTPEAELADFHEALRAKGFNFYDALRSYLLMFSTINRNTL